MTKLVRQLDTWHERHSKDHADPIHLWVVIETQQPPVSNDPMVAVQLDGRHIIRLLRQKAAAVIYDKSGQWLQNRPNEGWVHHFPWKGYHLAFLLGSDRRWTPLDSIAKAYVTNDNATPGPRGAKCHIPHTRRRCRKHYVAVLQVSKQLTQRCGLYGGTGTISVVVQWGSPLTST